MSEKNATNPSCVWVIDDEQDMVDATGEILRTSGFDFRGFIDPRDALSSLDAGDAPDLFLVDLNLPYLTGVEFIRDLRGRTELLATPIIVVTAMTTQSSTVNAFEAGADDVVRKPVSPAELLVRINGQLARTRRFDELRRQNRDLKLVTELARVLSQETELPDILRTLIDGLRSALDVERAATYLLHSDSGELHRALPSDPSKAEGSPRISLDLRTLPTVADALAARKTAFLDAEETAALIAAMGGSPPDGEQSSAAVVPMLDRGELVGVFVTVASRPHLGVTSRERFLFSIISNLAAVAVHRAHLFQTMLTDHRALDATNRELASTRDFLENVIQSSPDAIVASNRQGEIVIYNQAAERILGWKQAEALGSDVRMLYPPGGAERIFQKLRSSSFGGMGRLEPSREIVVDRNGREIPVEISASLLYSDERFSAAVGIFTDLRGRLRMEERLQEATENLERSRRQAVAAELAGAAAHELNQPLTSLLAYAELLERKVAEDDERFRAVSAIHRESERIADIVKKIGRITEYRTKEYVGGTRIVDLDPSSDVDQTAEMAEMRIDGNPDDDRAKDETSSESVESQ